MINNNNEEESLHFIFPRKIYIYLDTEFAELAVSVPVRVSIVFKRTDTDHIYLSSYDRSMLTLKNEQ